MHYIQLVDSIVLLFPQPKTIHKLHHLYHQLKATSNLDEAETILSREYTDLFYLYYDGKSTPVPIRMSDQSVNISNAYELIAVFTSLDECYSTYPELFI